VSTHALPQWVVVPRHWTSQVPPLQVGVPPEMPGQIWPHSPQFDVSEPVETQPLSQASVPLGQSIPHFPAAHTSPASHFTAQSPQCAASELVSTHAPLQSVRPVPHTMSQALFVHTAVPFGGASQVWSHAPQLSVSSSKRTQTPWQGE